MFLKTGAYRPSAVAYTMKFASEAKIDALSFDGAGGGTGMSPVPMMDEMSIPTLLPASDSNAVCPDTQRRKADTSQTWLWQVASSKKHPSSRQLR